MIFYCFIPVWFIDNTNILIKICMPELQPDDRCKTSETSLINWIYRKKFLYFSSPFYAFSQDVTRKLMLFVSKLS